MGTDHAVCEVGTGVVCIMYIHDLSTGVSNPHVRYKEQRNYANEPTQSRWHFSLLNLLLAVLFFGGLAEFLMSDACNKHMFVLDCIQ